MGVYRNVRVGVTACSIAAIVVLGLLSASDVSAGAATEQLEAGITRVLGTLESPAYKQASLEQRRVALRKIVDTMWDWNELAKRSLGRHWHGRTPAEQQDFARLLADLLERAMLSKIGLYDGETIAYLGERIEGDQAVVQTKVIARDGDHTAVDYTLVLSDGRQWKICDVDFGGMTLAGSYRTQFNRILRRASYQDLVLKLREKTRGSEGGVSRGDEASLTP